MRRALPLALVLAAGTGATAHARAPAPKPRAAQAPAEKAKLERALRARVGKKPAEVVNLWNLHTHEWLVLDADEKATLPAEVANEYFRCYFTNKPTAFDRRLLAVLARAAKKFRSDRVLIVSGYRARKYNLMLRKKGREVARDSQHSLGNAVDFVVPGVDAATLRDFVKSLRLGGVGYYPQSGFVHADTSRVRFWTGR